MWQRSSRPGRRLALVLQTQDLQWRLRSLKALQGKREPVRDPELQQLWLSQLERSMIVQCSRDVLV